MSRAVDLLRGGRWRCHSCDQEHEGMFDLGADAPWHWEGQVPVEPNRAVRLDGDFLSPDYCVIGGRDYFVRGLLFIPVIGLDDCFAFGCWSTLSRPNFERYVEQFDGIALDEPWTGWFSNEFAPFLGTVNAPCWVMPQTDSSRPEIWLDDGEHPLSIAQRDGITPEQLLDIYRQHGHPVD